MGFLEAYKAYWKNYVNFSGRASVSEYWFAALWNILILGVLYTIITIVSVFTFASVAAINDQASFIGAIPLMLLSLVTTLYSLACIIPSLSLTIRRLHDSNKSGWMILLGLIPMVGGIILIVLMCLSSETGRVYTHQDNEFDI